MLKKFIESYCLSTLGKLQISSGLIAHERRRRSGRSKHRHIPADDYSASGLFLGILKSLAIIGVLSSVIYGILYLPFYSIGQSELGSENEKSVQEAPSSIANMADSHSIDDSTQPPVETAALVDPREQSDESSANDVTTAPAIASDTGENMDVAVIESNNLNSVNSASSNPEPDNPDLETLVVTPVDVAEEVVVRNGSLRNANNPDVDVAKSISAEEKSLISVNAYKAALFKDTGGVEEVENANLKYGDKIRVLGEKGRWRNVLVIKNGARGYIHSTQVSAL